MLASPKASKSDDNIIKAIAFYLPQFHPIPENDKWWGEGFTEWWNVSKAKPLFSSHYQPHLPANLGFYDLRLPEAREAQAAMARDFGIHGFCYYHYWFNGRRLLQRPFNEVLASGKPDFPFTLCWANENWTRRWDGKESEVLMEQSYSEEDDLNHIRQLIPAFRDPRYIRVDGLPLFLVYQVMALPQPQRTAEIWRSEAIRSGLPGLYLVSVEGKLQARTDPTRIGFDASVEFQPDWNLLTSLHVIKPSFKERIKARLQHSTPPHSKHTAYEYGDVVETMIRKPNAAYTRFPCVTPSWDNTARRQWGGVILENATPDLYQHWLEATIARMPTMNLPEPILFLNAWNEWAEGNHLEPDQRWGLAYLQATKTALLKTSPFSTQ
jgi:lipopolysaccharide biosynthesis protein